MLEKFESAYLYYLEQIEKSREVQKHGIPTNFETIFFRPLF